jgi:membrane protease subunit (stomatin/prohibitin family)
MNKLDTIPHALLWAGHQDGLAFSGPLSLAAHGGLRLEVLVDEDQVALIVEEGEVVATLSPGRHLALVRDYCEEPEDLSLQEIARRLGMEASDAAAEMDRIRHLGPSQNIVFINVGALETLPWGEEAQTPFMDEVHGRIELHVEGLCALHVSDPVAFHDSFLRHAEDFDPQNFPMLASALVHGSFIRCLHRLPARAEELPPEPREFAMSVRPILAEALGTVGLAIDDLEITHLAIRAPGGELDSARAESGPTQGTPAQTADLGVPNR